MKIVKSLFILAFILVLIAVIAVPPFLRISGLYPEYPNKEDININISGKRILIITTSTHEDHEYKPTGAILAEIAIPYFILNEHGAAVDIASIAGGDIPIEPLSKSYFFRSKYDKKAIKDPGISPKLEASQEVRHTNFLRYDAIIITGGWGAAYDMKDNTILSSKLQTAYNNGIIIASIDFGILPLLKITNSNGASIFTNNFVTTITNVQLDELAGIHKPYVYPEQEVIKLNPRFKRNRGYTDSLQNRVEVIGNTIITGQNQNSAETIAYIIIEALSRKK